MLTHPGRSKSCTSPFGVHRTRFSLSDYPYSWWLLSSVPSCTFCLSLPVCASLYIASRYFIERGTWDDTLGTFINSDGDPSQCGQSLLTIASSGMCRLASWMTWSTFLTGANRSSPPGSGFDMDHYLKGHTFMTHPTNPVATPLYYTVLCSIRSLIERLVSSHLAPQGPSPGGYYLMIVSVSSDLKTRPLPVSPPRMHPPLPVPAQRCVARHNFTTLRSVITLAQQPLELGSNFPPAYFPIPPNPRPNQSVGARSTLSASSERGTDTQGMYDDQSRLCSYLAIDTSADCVTSHRELSPPARRAPCACARARRQHRRVQRCTTGMGYPCAIACRRLKSMTPHTTL
jgi:hypothetical protein